MCVCVCVCVYLKMSGKQSEAVIDETNELLLQMSELRDVTSRYAALQVEL